jgi:predicted membrane channel-forming protein YqfA (hemolysin III family)
MYARRTERGNHIAPGWANSAVHALIGLIGVLTAIVLAIYCYQATVGTYGPPSALWLSFFTFAMSAYILGHGLADLITEPHRLERVLYFALMPLIASACLYVAYQLWATVWLAVLCGLMVGGTVHGAITWLLMPEIARDERRGHRLNDREVRWSEPAPHDRVPEWAPSKDKEPTTVG